MQKVKPHIVEVECWGLSLEAVVSFCPYIEYFSANNGYNIQSNFGFPITHIGEEIQVWDQSSVRVLRSWHWHCHWLLALRGTG